MIFLNDNKLTNKKEIRIVILRLSIQFRQNMNLKKNHVYLYLGFGIK